MSRALITMQLRSARRELAMDSLESRLVMSATGSPATAASQLLAKISVTPGDGQIFSDAAAPRQIVVNLKAAQLAGLPPVGFSWSDDAVFLEQVGSDDRISVVGDRSKPTPAVLDPAAQTATIPLASPLEPGRYRIVLAGGSMLAQLLSDPSWNSDADHTLVEFQVVGKPATLDNAIDLGDVGSAVGSASGALDLQGHGVALYKITLGTSQPLWRLGLQINAWSMGSPLRSALTLFDQQGRALASRTAGEGLGSAVNDPYLYVALKPGVYYVGVSGAGNIGGAPGGYDPTTGAPGISTGIGVVGPYQLEIVADPASSATSVVGFSLQSADPTSTSPTGFTISFSGAIDPASLAGDPLYVQDQQGNSFPVLFGSAGSGLNQLGFWFNQPLPPGRYSLVAPTEGGLTDLIGQTPIAPGLPAGTLATWTVDATPTGANGGEVGVPAGFSRVSDTLVVASGRAVLPGGGEVTYRLLIPPHTSASLNTDAIPSSLRVMLMKSDGTVVDGSSISNQDLYSKLGGKYADLDGGVYLLTLSAVGSKPLTITWSLTLQSKRDAQVANAVGSAGALGLRFGASSSSSGAPIGPASAAPSFAAPGQGSITTLPSSYTITVGSTLVGRPSVGNDAIAAVGSSSSIGLVALAAPGRGLAAGILSAGGYGDDGLLRDPEGLVVTRAATAALAERSGPQASIEKPRQDVAETRGDEADVLALLEADRLSNAARSVAWWLFGGAEDDRAAIATADRLDPATRAGVEATAAELQRELRVDLEQSGKVERAALGAPVSLVVAAAAAFRFRQFARKYWRRSSAASATAKATQAPLWRGPRYMVPPSRRMSRARNAHHV